MMKRYLSSLLIALIATPALAGWQNKGYYMDDGYYEDDGSRFTISVRGGLSFANAKMKNEIGNLYADYWINNTTGEVVTDLAYTNGGSPDGYTYIGSGDLSELSMKEGFSKNAFTAGASIGFTVPFHPQWRLEAGFDHIAETDYNKIPLFEGDLDLSSGLTVHIRSTGAKSSVTTDVISAMAFYDFFEGERKQVNQIIPYIGVGVGYAVSKTKLHLTDIYGDLSQDLDLKNYGTPDSDNVIQFNNVSDDSAPSSTNIAVLGSVGVAYGITESTFLDLNARVMYIPRITWQLVSNDGSQHRDWYAAENMIYTNIMLGLRFEF